MARTGLSPTSLELEVTEDILLHDEQGALSTFLKIQELGVRIVFDDFGTGFASLSYLKKFPLDGLKIDSSFVFGLLANPDDAAIVSSTIGLSKQLGLSVIAEGIENRATADFLVSMGCEEGQGYFFGRPMPAERIRGQIPDRRRRGGLTAVSATPMVDGRLMRPLKLTCRDQRIFHFFPLASPRERDGSRQRPQAPPANKSRMGIRGSGRYC